MPPAICSRCKEYINGFDYGFGYNPLCGECHKKEQIQSFENEKLQLEIKLLKLKLETYNK